MENLKTKLTIILKAGDTVVAEIDDASLWNKVLSSATNMKGVDTETSIEVEENFEETSFDSPKKEFAKQLEISIEKLEGALDPSSEPPFLHLDHSYYEKFRKVFPKKGPNSVSDMALASTALTLWAKIHPTVDFPKQTEVLPVLKSIGLEDKNPSRSLKNCDWLRMRDGKIMINPEKFSKAREIVKGYCIGDSNVK